MEFLFSLEPRIDLEIPYELALRYSDLNVLRQLEKCSRHNATYLRNGELQIAFILTKGLADWEKKSQTIEFLVKNASADVNATGMDGLAAVHVAAVNNHIAALELLEKLQDSSLTRKPAVPCIWKNALLPTKKGRFGQSLGAFFIDYERGSQS